MYTILTILSIISFYASFICMIVIYKTKNKKLKPLLFILFGASIIIFFIWGIYRNFNLPEWYFK